MSIFNMQYSMIFLLQRTTTSSKEGIVLEISERGKGNADRISQINSLKNNQKSLNE